MAIVEIKVPDIGDFAEVTVIELMVKPGDSINGVLNESYHLEP